MSGKFISNLALGIAVFSIGLIGLRSFNIVDIPLMVINLLFVILLSIMTWINYKNNRKFQMYVGIVLMVAFVIAVVL
ncbi:hypothetical protein [Paraclostridium bifermentans]|uniref:hypothetical protein n=1 Tax=Paraclostridium bifermentans TaxID=1490 RepID=UPI00359C4E63